MQSHSRAAKVRLTPVDGDGVVAAGPVRVAIPARVALSEPEAGGGAVRVVVVERVAAPELEAFHRIKAALDPSGLLNPGKAVPTLHRCAEFGRMHVHGGVQSFPELPRF